MKKYLILMVASFGLCACDAKNAEYYSNHPAALETVLKNCPQQPSSGMTCEQLQILAQRLNALSMDLRSNPQAYGQGIMLLQNAIAKQEQSLQGNPEQADLRQALKQNKDQLTERLAVVKWLESPEK